MRSLLIIILVSCSSFYAVSQEDTMSFSSKVEASKYIYNQLDPKAYDCALLNRSISSNPSIYKQFGREKQITTTQDWLNIYSDIALSYTDTTLINSIPIFAQKVYDFFTYQDYHFSNLNQPFGLILQNISLIDTSHYLNGNIESINGQIISNIDESQLYRKVLIKSASILEFYSDNGYSYGTLKYDSTFISTSSDIKVNSIHLDLDNGNGFEVFGQENPELTYSRYKDSTIAKAAISYALNDVIYQDTILFYLTLKSNVSQNQTKSTINDCDKWDECREENPINNNGLKYDIGIKYGCGNGSKIRRPIIISCAYRPIIQPFSLNKYWNQFNIGGLFDSFVNLGYDVIFVKDKPGNHSLQVAGRELAEFIKNINVEKKSNYPDEDWETIVIGYSMGGQKARFALMELENEHMEQDGPHHHTRLYIPFDSPHHGASIPLFTQAVYKEYAPISLLATLANMSLIDNASNDMGYYSIYASDLLSSSNIIKKDYLPKPHLDAVNYQNEINNNFIHHYTHLSDTRKSFPSFCRNIAVSMGSFKTDYNMKWGLFPGKSLFDQHSIAFNIPVDQLPNVFLGFVFGFVNRELLAVKYSNTPQKSFHRSDLYISLFGYPFYIKDKYNFKNAFEWDMAQGGNKTLFFDGLTGGATTILRLETAGIGIQGYKNEVNFMPLVSSLAINPTIWQNNNLYFNLQDEGLMYKSENDLNEGNFSTTYGYPNLAHPIDHFNITPFEAVYADSISWDHIVMGNTLDEYLNDDQSYYGKLRDFLNDEVEGYIVSLQNKVIGQNHTLNPSFRYKAWYKSRYQVVIGNNVTPKTDEGNYIIEKSGDITTYAGSSIIIKPGFQIKSGGTFHAYIQNPSSCYYNGLVADENTEFEEEKMESDFLNKSSLGFDDKSKSNITFMSIVPNPNNGIFTLNISKNILNGTLTIIGMDGKIYHNQELRSTSTEINASLKKGLYIVSYQSSFGIETLKLIIN